jgi:putative ABC transport system permease protein
LYLALANLLHHKFRSLLSALAVGIGVAMLVTLLGLTHGTLGEISQRGAAIDADFLVMPNNYNSVMGGAVFSEAHVTKGQALKTETGLPLVAKIGPVYRDMTSVNRVDAAKRAKDLQTVFGIHASDWSFFGNQPLVAGKMEDFAEPADREAKLIDLLNRGIDGQPHAASQPSDADRTTLEAALVMIVDQRLADFARIRVGDKVEAFGRTFTVVGIARTGVAVRVFVPLSTMWFINESPRRASFLLVKLAGGADPAAAKATLARELGGNVLTVQEYSNLLTELWAIIPQYTQITSLVVLAVAFLFVLVIMYTLVIQRTREIGVLKALGAGTWFIVGTVLAESMILSLTGTVMGLAASVGAKAAIMHFKPLLTVDLSWQYLLTGLATGLVGGVLSGLYPAAVAARQDPVTALSYE